MLSTGITLSAPLNKAAAMVEVARNTSIITTTLFLILYKSNKRGVSTVEDNADYVGS